MSFDYFIKDGIVINGSVSDPAEANIGIKGDRIAYVGSEVFDADKVIDARDLFVSPGFIDTHGHSEFTLLADGRAETKLLQGVTTEINGNCGLSAAPLSGEALEAREDDLGEYGIRERWHTFSEYFHLLEERRTGLNFATLCGHGNLRGSVVGYRDREATEDEIIRMEVLLRRSLKEGAKGLSTGLIYPPGMYAGTRELGRLASLLREDGHAGVYATHMRSEGDDLLGSAREALKIGREGGVKVHISHLKTAGEKNWGKIEGLIGLIGESLSAGVPLTCDRYPYVASGTGLDSLLPGWAHDGGAEETLRKLREGGAAERIRGFLKSYDDNYWRGIIIASLGREENRWMEGKSVSLISEMRGVAPVDLVMGLLIEERLRVGAVFFSMSEENLRRILCLPNAMIGSDSSVRSFSGITRHGKPHPRGVGSFPRFLGRYVRDDALLPLPEAIRRLTGLPAGTFGLYLRGLIREGYFADVAVFDYNVISDNASYQDPFSRPEGVVYLFVNGIPVVYESGLTGSLPGRILH